MFQDSAFEAKFWFFPAMFWCHAQTLTRKICVFYVGINIPNFVLFSNQVPSRDLRVDVRANFVQDEQRDLQCIPMTSAIYVLEDVSTHPGFLIWAFSVIFEHLPFVPGCTAETVFGQSVCGQSVLGQFCVAPKVGPRRGQTQKKWGPRRVGGPKIVRFFLCRHIFLSSVFSWNFGGFCEDRDPQMCTFGRCLGCSGVQGV